MCVELGCLHFDHNLGSVVSYAAWRNGVQGILRRVERLYRILIHFDIRVLLHRLPEAGALLDLAIFEAIFVILLLELFQQLLGAILDQLSLSVELLLWVRALALRRRCQQWVAFGLGTEVESRGLADPQVRIDVVLVFILR